jgi:P27 family predicted phage terminase small subunit
MKGRKPKSIAEHKLNGNPSKLDLKERENRIIKLPFDVSAFKPPKFISKNKVAKKVWIKTVADLNTKGVLAGVDMPLLAAYCFAYASMVKHAEFLNRIPENDPYTKLTNSGYLQTLPQIAMYRQAAADVKSYGAELFCTPVSRQRLGPDDKDGDTDTEMDNILNQTQARIQKGLKAIKGKK